MRGDDLREMRLRLDTTQVELAERLGTTSNTVARWERGEVGIPEPAARLACALFVLWRRERARGEAIREELGVRVGSTDRDKTMEAAKRAEHRAIRELNELLGAGALSWWSETGKDAMREVRVRRAKPEGNT